MAQRTNSPNLETPNVIAVIGGLGNQLFQFAFGELLAHHTGRPTLYDLSAFDWYAKHGGFGLETAFDITLPRWNSAEAPLVAAPLRTRNVRRIFTRYPQVSGLIPGLRADDGGTFFNDPGLKGRANYFVGTWQWQPYTREQMKLVTSKLPFRPGVQEVVAKAQLALSLDPQSVAAIHVRMGDYLSAGKHCHLPLSEAYYTQVMQKLLRTGKASSFAVFSDGMAQIAGKWFKDLPVTFVDSYPGQNGITDLCLLSRFSTLVISASTFGWWAAALSEHGAEVHFPYPWVRDMAAHKPRYWARPLDGWRAKDARGHDLERDGPKGVRSADQGAV